jgi:hypothetical protein
MHRPSREHDDTVEPAPQWQIIKTDLKANGFTWLRIVSDVRYTVRVQELIPGSHFVCRVLVATQLLLPAARNR